MGVAQLHAADMPGGSADSTELSTDNIKDPAEIRLRIDEISEEISEKKDAKKALKSTQSSLEQLGSSTGMLASEIGSADFEKDVKTAIDGLARVMNSEKVYDAVKLLWRPVSSFSERIYQFSPQEKNMELQSTILTIQDKIEKYRLLITSAADMADKNDIANALSIDKLKELHGSIQGIINDAQAKTTEEIEQLDTDIRHLMTLRSKLQGKLDTKSDATQTIFQWGFPAFIVFILGLYLFPLIIHKNKRHPEKDAASEETKMYSSIYGTGLVTEIITVFLLTSTILLLGLTDKLNSEILGTLIGGISGYVLGRSSFKSNKGE